MTESADPGTKRSIARLRRLRPMLETKLSDATGAVEILVAEAESGEPRPELWEQLHAAGARDDMLIELGSAYEQLAKGRRLRPLPPAMQAEVLMHGADFLQGILGDPDGAAALLQQVLNVVPEHTEAFNRLERHLTASKQDRRIVDLYALIVAAKADPPVLLIGRALAVIERLPTDPGLSLDICKTFVRAADASSRVIPVLEAHLRSGGRLREAAAILELFVESSKQSPADLFEPRRRLVALYMTDLKTPEAAMPHIEELLRIEPGQPEACKAAERLLGHAEVASRAAAALQESRRRTAQKA